MKNNSISNILIEQNNIFAVTCNYQNVNKHGNLNTSYFSFHDSIVSVDLDSKYYNLSSGYRKQFSNIYKLAFGNKESLRFNILDEIEEETAYNDAFEIANILVTNCDNPNNMHDIRDFLIMIILHVKCSDFKSKNLCGCFDFLLYYTNDDDSINKLSNIFDNIENSYHCTSAIHEIVRTNSKRFKNMSKNMIETVYHKALSLLSIFQNINLKSISSQSDFCINDFVMNKTKSLYITLSSSELDIYSSYIKMIISIFITKIKKYYSQNIFNRNSVLFLIEDFQNTIQNPLYIHYHSKKYLPNINIDLKNKLKLPVIHSRTYLLKECKKTLKHDVRQKMWYDIPEDLYMQDEDVILEPLFTSRISDDEELEKISNIFNDSNNYDDDGIKRLFKPTDSSSSVSKDPDYEKNKNNIEIIYHREIVKKNMYYTPKNEKEINELLNIFSHEQFDKLMEQFKQKSQRLGFICILTGSAGVGKTETVLQIARICQRNIVKYDATQISSGYIGVAACKVKDIFESYNKVVKNSKTYPILFLNEADSFLSRRIDLSCSFNQVSSLDENRTQTILLESLENFQGIMIATTNIISNFDHAFERRFLYKIIFDKPDRNTRVKILKNMLPQLNEDELQYITGNYDLTGAQIENISRKLDIKKVIKNDTSFDDVKELCKEETDNCFTLVNKSIGFK